MSYELELEHIGGHRPWIARIVGVDGKYELVREFQDGGQDYSQSNRPKSRGVYTSWTLEDGIYEVCGESTGGSAGARNFIRVSGEKSEKISIHDVKTSFSSKEAGSRGIGPAKLN